eukprot:3786553-Lingulodinium_polyedra.AAC.1
MGGKKGMVIQKGMMRADFFSFIDRRYEVCGRRIDNMDVSEEPDWECKDGEYSLVTLEPEADN